MRKWIIAMLITAATNADAQQIVPLSLQQAYDITLNSNYDIRIAGNNLTASKALNTAGNAGALPIVAASARDKESSTDIQQEFSNGTNIQRNGVASNTMSGDAIVSYILFNGFRIQASRERLNAVQKLNQEELLSGIQNTLANVTVKYFDVVRQYTYRKALMRSRDFSEKKLEIINARTQAGLSNDADLFQARIDFNTTDQNLAEQHLLIRKSEVELAQLLALSPDTFFLLNDSILIDRSISRDTVFSFIDQQPQLASATAKIVISEQQLREIRSQRYPSLRLDGGYSYNRSANAAGFSLLNIYHGPAIGATLQVPLYNGGAVKSQEKAVRLQIDNARLEQEKTRLNLKAQAVASYEAYTTALNQLDAQQESFRLAGQVLDIQLMRFKEGQSTILDLRAAQSSYEQTAAALVNAMFVAKIAETELKRLMCRLGS